MGKRTLSPEHLAKLQAGREKKQALKRLEELESVPEVKEVADKLEEPQVKPEEIAPEQSTNDLQRQLDEMKAAMAFMMNNQGQSSDVSFNRQGGLVGTFEKYTVDPANYPDPTERLMKEARLAPFAFDYNYEIDYQVHVSQYDTKDGRNVKEPRFMMELRKVVLDEDGNPTNDRYIVRKLTFHEDPQAAIQVARENGIKVDEFNEADFLNEMRYIRARDWLLDIFYPPKAQATQSRRQEVINNQVVDVITINSENSQSIPFNQLGSKPRT
jgi:hypothetical protein